MPEIRKFRKVLIANRGEIAIRVIRACRELGIRTVAIYSAEDKNSLFRTKAHESYEIGKGKSPIDAYLDIDEIIRMAKTKGCDAIHPGYGFLSENADFAEACEEAGIAFIGPTHEMMNRLGDKIQSKMVADEVGVPCIPGVEAAISNDDDAIKFANAAGYPIMLKAAAGGGGRGMRIVRKEEDLLPQFHSAQNEAVKAFGNGDIFIEKYIEEPKHIEVQVLGEHVDALGKLAQAHLGDVSRHRCLRAREAHGLELLDQRTLGADGLVANDLPDGFLPVVSLLRHVTPLNLRPMPASAWLPRMVNTFFGLYVSNMMHEHPRGFGHASNIPAGRCVGYPLETNALPLMGVSNALAPLGELAYDANATLSYSA